MRRVPGGVSAAPRGIACRGLLAPASARVCGLGLAALLGLLAPEAARAQDPGAPAAPTAPSIDKKLEGSAKAGSKEVALAIHYPGAEKDAEVWAKWAKETVEKGLPELAAAAGFDFPREKLDVKFAFGPSDTDGYDAALREGTLFVRKHCDRKEPGHYRAGARSFWVLYALARGFSEQAVRPEWLRSGLAHLLTYHALKKLPAMYDARTYRDELLEEMKKRTDDGPLDQWSPTPPAAGGAGAASAVERSVTPPEAAAAFGFLYEADEMCDGAVRKSIAEVGASGSPVGGKDFLAAVIRAGGEKAGGDALFAGWATVNPAQTIAPKLDKTDLIDSDADGLLNFQETIAGTEKAKPDTDGDGAIDGEEVEDGTDPKKKDARRSKVKLDGDPAEWMRLKKFQFQDKVDDHKEKVTGADVRRVDICSDEKNIYVRLEADSFENADVAYQICFDNGDDGVAMDSSDPAEQRQAVWNYVVGFRGDGSKWIGETHNVKDWSWAQWKNHRRVTLAVKGTTAELRIPKSAFDLPPKFLFMVYTTARDGAVVTDSVARQVMDLAKFRIDQ